MEKTAYESLNKIKEKYSIDFDLYKYNENESYYSLANSIIREKKFLETMVCRIKNCTAIFILSPKLPLEHWSLFIENINYYSGRDSYVEELSDILILATFLNNFFYIDGTWKKDKAELLKNLIEDETLIELVRYYTGEADLKKILRETSYYYDDEVWNIVKDLFVN